MISRGFQEGNYSDGVICQGCQSGSGPKETRFVRRIFGATRDIYKVEAAMAPPDFGPLSILRIL